MSRLSSVWLFLIVVELFCPAFCDLPAFAAETGNNFKSPKIVSSEFEKKISFETSYSITYCQGQTQEETACQDECLCHAAVIPNLNIIKHKESVIRSEAADFDFTEPVLASLPPPDQPPKLS